ncbi:response regulator [Vibrio sp. M60_M31a]
MIFMDIQMPHMDGVTACKHIKQIELNKDTPVIAVTAHAMAGERDRLLAAGMDDYLTQTNRRACAATGFGSLEPKCLRGKLQKKSHLRMLMNEWGKY